MHDDEPIIEGVSYGDGETAGDDEEELIPEEEAANPAQAVRALRQKLKACQAERQAYLEGWQRSKADYINLKKTHEEDRKRLALHATERVIEDFLTVADSFEMAFANKAAWEDLPENWRKGVEYIYSQFQSTFRSHGLEEISALGQPFDPARHHALATTPTDKEEEDHTVL
ncbi:MAG TPA: nucleotide exchange factor GrpE, partial [Candidatus Paceibacterota bacterium]|nr:nucleotide exchange factor GrpE [Candidatus Paceibacterota bacterium]